MFLFGPPNVSRLKAARNVNGLIKALQYHNNEEVVTSAVTALGEIGDARAVEPIIAAYKTVDFYLDIQEALEAIGAAGVEPLVAALKDNSSLVRYNVTKILGSIGDARAVEPLIAMLGDSDHEVRGSAAEALGKLGDNRAVMPLIGALKGDESGVRLSATRALGELRDIRAVPALEAALRDDFWVVREDAAIILEKLGRKPPKEQLLQNSYDLLDTADNRVACDAAEALLREGGIEGVRWLVKALHSSNEDRYRTATWAFTYALDRFRAKMDEKELAALIRETIPVLEKTITGARLQPGLSYLAGKTVGTLNMLAVYGDASVLPALLALRDKIKKRRQMEGYRREYVQTEEYGGWVDNDGSGETVDDVIKQIRRRAEFTGE